MKMPAILRRLAAGRAFKPGIFAKLFLALLFSLLLLLGATLASMHWSFRHGLAEYLHRVEIEKLGKVVDTLSAAYRREGGWDFLREDRHVWYELLHRSLGEREDEGEPRDRPHPRPERERFRPPPPDMGGPPDFDDVFGPPPDRPPDFHEPRDFREPPGPHGPHGRRGPPRDPLFLPGRLRLLDAERRPVTGRPPLDDAQETLLPIAADGKTVGWLALAPNRLITDRLALSFLEQQIQANFAVLGLALLMSAFVSLFLAKHLLSPLKRIAGGLKSLAEGAYEVKIERAGRDELGDLARDFNLLARVLQRNETSRRQWIADISHELRTPLSILRGEIEALLDGIRQATPERLRSLHAETLALGKLVDNLYELSLSDLGAMHYRFAPVDLAALLTDAAAGFAARFQDKGIALRLPELAQRDLTVSGDAQRLRQLFANLLENACRYTDAGGRCEIALARTKTAAIAEIRDSAPGVPKEALARLFDRFYRADASRSREHGGAGLGLAICQNIVDAHGGRIAAAASPLGGISIRVEIPLLPT